MIKVDKTDFLYRTLLKLGVQQQDMEDRYLSFANEGVSNIREFNNALQSRLGLDYLGEFDDQDFEEVVDYYSDLKLNKAPAKSKVLGMLKQYKTSPDESLRQAVINAQLKDVLLTACAYKLRHADINLGDLVQTCNMGLMTAVDKFDINARMQFETYLNYWVLEAINNEFTKGEKNG